MNAADLEIIRRRRPEFASGATVRLVTTPDPRSEALRIFCATLALELPGFRFQAERAEGLNLPFIDAGEGLRFRAVPTEAELAPFLDALSPALRGQAAVTLDHRELLERIALPRDVQLYVAPGCPHCPASVRQWTALTRTGPNLRLWVVDAALFPEAAADDGVRAVPTLVLEGNWRWSGQIPVADVLAQLSAQDPAKLSAAALEGLLKEGQAGAVARAMQAQQVVFPGLIDLLSHPKWSVRLGAMAAMEYLAEADPLLARAVVPPLQARYAQLEDQTKGDVLYVMGETGGPHDLAWLEGARTEAAGRELRQAAAEALARLRARQTATKTGQG